MRVRDRVRARAPCGCAACPVYLPRISRISPLYLARREVARVLLQKGDALRQAVVVCRALRHLVRVRVRVRVVLGLGSGL